MPAEELLIIQPVIVSLAYCHALESMPAEELLIIQSNAEHWIESKYLFHTSSDALRRSYFFFALAPMPAEEHLIIQSNAEHWIEN